MWKTSKKQVFLLLVLLLLCSASHAQGAQQVESQLAETSSSISSKLIDLKKNSAIVTEQLRIVSERLVSSQSEVETLKEQSMTLSNSLITINEQLSDCYTTIEIQKQRIQLKNKVLTILIIIFSIFIIAKILCIILYSKGVKVPRIIDIIA